MNSSQIKSIQNSIKQFESVYNTAKWFTFLKSKLNTIKKENGSIFDETAILYYLLLKNTKYIVTFIDNDPDLSSYFYKKQIELTVNGYKNYQFFVENKTDLVDKSIKLFVYFFLTDPSKKLGKTIPYQFEKNNNNLLKSLLNNATIYWLNKSIYLQRVNKLNLKEYLDKLKKVIDILQNQFTIIEQEELMFISGTVYMLYGLRSNSDFDMIGYDLDLLKNKKFLKSVSEKQLLDIEFPKNEKSKKKFEVLIFEPQNYFYFNGMKMITVVNDINILRRSRIEDVVTYNKSGNPLKKLRPRAIADYLMIKKLLKIEPIYPLRELSKKNRKKVIYFIKQRYKEIEDPFTNN